MEQTAERNYFNNYPRDMLDVVNKAPGKPGGWSLAVGRATSAFGRQPSALLSF